LRREEEDNKTNEATLTQHKSYKREINKLGKMKTKKTNGKDDDDEDEDEDML